MTTKLLYIFSTERELTAVKEMILAVAEKMHRVSNDEHLLNIPTSVIINALAGDTTHLGLLIGMDTTKSGHIVLCVKTEDETPLCDALADTFNGIEVVATTDTEQTI